MTLGQRLRELRLAHDPPRRQRDVAYTICWDLQAWSRIEAGYERPPWGVIQAAGEYLGGDIMELLRLWQEWTPAPLPDLSKSICDDRRQRR